MTSNHKHLSLDTISKALIHQWEDTELAEHDRKTFHTAHALHGEDDEEDDGEEQRAHATAWEATPWNWADNESWYSFEDDTSEQEGAGQVPRRKVTTGNLRIGQKTSLLGPTP